MALRHPRQLQLPLQRGHLEGPMSEKTRLGTWERA